VPTRNDRSGNDFGSRDALEFNRRNQPHIDAALLQLVSALRWCVEDWLEGLRLAPL